MKSLIYAIVYLLIVAYIFGFFLNKLGVETGFNTSNLNESLYISSNGGKNWSEIGSKQLSNKQGYVIFGGENYSKLYLASVDGIFQIKNNKVLEKEKPAPFKGNVIKYIQNPYNSNIVYLILKETTNQKLLLSYNAGQNFKTVLILDKNDAFSAFEIDPILYSTIYVGTQRGAFLVSNDAGETWQKRQDFSPKAIYSIGVRKTDGTIFLGVTEKPFDISYFVNPPLTPEYPEILFSVDGGNTFLNLKEGFNTTNLDKNFLPTKIISDTNGKTYLVSKDKIYFIQENQIMLFNIILPSASTKISDFIVDSQNSNIIYLAAGNILYKTEDGGISWQTIQSPNQKKIKEIKLNPKDSNIILLSTVG